MIEKIGSGTMVRITGKDLAMTHKPYIGKIAEVIKLCKGDLIQVKVKGLALASIPRSNIEVWNDPGTWPPMPGEYRAVMNLCDYLETNRRYWDGRQWSAPYHVNWPEESKAMARGQTSGFLVHWQPV